LNCHPNPVQTSLNLTFQLPNSSFGNVDIFASNGVAVKNVTRGQWFTQGENIISIPTNDLAAGSYFVRFSSETMYGVQSFIRVE
jgi:Secretion system C-terminal sorting domain